MLAPRVHELRYEEYVANFERETRALAQFLELDWDDRMLAPGARAQAKGFISTPSYSQVVQPVNTRSVGRWRNYQDHVGPVLAPLQALMNRWSYAA